MSFNLQNILVLDSVDSTNNYAMALIQNNDEDSGKPVFALEQTHGKGRRGRHWKSAAGDNIILSVPLQMQWLTVSRQFELSVAVALSCYDLVSKYIHKEVTVKWPNDIFINATKAGGVLIENIIKGTLWQWAIVGIGININQKDFGLHNFKATSLSLVSREDYNVLDLAKELYGNILKRTDDLKTGNFEKMLQEYNKHLFAMNKTVKLKKQNAVFETTILGVSATGELITKDAFERHFHFDDVEFKGLV